MELVEINEPVKVGAVFSGDAVHPKWFMWHNRKYAIRETTYTWHEREGEVPVMHFAVSDGLNLFELSLNQKTLAWRLEKTQT